jgi:hypothetical protein
MFKEIKDVKKICESIINKLDNIRNSAVQLENLVDKVKSETSQEKAAEITLSIRKELANLFILNSNVEDNLKILQKIYKSLEKIR